jgi:hypothetical protein
MVVRYRKITTKVPIIGTFVVIGILVMQNEENIFLNRNVEIILPIPNAKYISYFAVCIF